MGAWQKSEEERMESGDAKVGGGAGGIHIVDAGVALGGCNVRGKKAR